MNHFDLKKKLINKSSGVESRIMYEWTNTLYTDRLQDDIFIPFIIFQIAVSNTDKFICDVDIYYTQNKYRSIYIRVFCIFVISSLPIA